MIKDNQKVFNRLLVIIDALITAASFVLAYYIKFYILNDGPGIGPSTLGPINRPAMISPTTCGALHFLAMIPNTLANIIMIARSLKIL